MKKINNTTFEEKIANEQVEIGKKERTDFKPSAKLFRWGNECSFEVEYPTSKKIQPDFKDKEKDKEKVKWVDNDREIHFYKLPPNNQNHGALEMEVILSQKPSSNVLRFNFNSEGLKFYYQRELTKEEKEAGNFRPLNVVGSYAVYHATKGPVHKSKEEAEKYKVGKAFHIYRPRIEDADGNKVWGELNIDEKKGELTVTIPQEFLDNATYPIRHAAGATFGYETAGGTAEDMEDYIEGSVFAGAAGTGDSISAYVEVDGEHKCAIYKHSDSGLVTDGVTEVLSGSGTAEWRTANFSTSPTLEAVDYVLVAWGRYNAYGVPYLYYDDGVTDQGHSDSETYNSFPDPASFTHKDKKYSIYCTYTPSGDGEPTKRRRGFLWW